MSELSRSITNTRLEPRIWNELGVAIVGAGGIVNDAHLPAYRAHDVNVVGCFDTDQQRAKEIAGKFGLPRVYSSLEELLADPAVRIVDIAVPAKAQLAIASSAAAAGKHLLCQKPLAEEEDEARAIAGLAAAHSVKISVNQQMRWSPVILAAKRVLDGGWLGTVTDARIDVSVATPFELWPWLAAAERYDLLYHSIHHLDAIRYLLGNPQRITSILGRMPGQSETCETRSTTILELPSDVQASVLTNHHDHSRDTFARLRILGNEGVLQGTIGLLYDYPHGRADTLMLQSERLDICETSLDGRWIPDAFIGPMAGLMDAVMHNKKPPTDATDNLLTVAMVLAAYRSAAERRSVDL
ncbi:MAG: Gfo/Idh/MocA family oxidoreductase [Actinomycetota bacterium]